VISNQNQESGLRAANTLPAPSGAFLGIHESLILGNECPEQAPYITLTNETYLLQNIK
jgi:hypothetical protein